VEDTTGPSWIYGVSVNFIHDLYRYHIWPTISCIFHLHHGIFLGLLQVLFAYVPTELLCSLAGSSVI
jgi:hypothetical protein